MPVQNRSYPKTRFELFDFTSIPMLPVDYVYDDTPVLMMAFTSDKGPEGWTMLKSFSEFNSLYGGIDFDKHGQSNLIIADFLRSGGYALVKRLVSNNATLANVTVHARVVVVDEVNYIYIYATSEANCYTRKEAEDAGFGKYDYGDEDAYDFPLFTITTNGRFLSNMSFRMAPEYQYSRSTSCIRYSFEIIENNEILGTVVCSMNPEYMIETTQQSIESKINTGTGQIRCKLHEKGFYGFARLLSKTAMIDNELIDLTDIINYDLLNGTDKRGIALGNVVAFQPSASEEANAEWVANRPDDISGTLVNLQYADGIPIINGSYGDLGPIPIENTNEYTKLLLGAWGKNQDSEQFDPVIYDLDAIKPACVFDAAYPVSVKNAIIDVADWRGDLMFFADFGKTGLTTLTEILEASDQLNKSRYCAMYGIYGDIYDSYSKKQITVTLPYLLATRFVAHAKAGIGRPFAGIVNNFTLPEFIDGTINFLPIVIPNLDQKQQLANACVNYVNYYDGVPVVETLYVNYPEYTQLSFLHNILNIQKVIRAIRSECPKIRYSFLDSDSLQEYMDDVNTVIRRYQGSFKSIDMQYMNDERYELNKIFYATITVSFFDFVQEEYFKIYAIN